MKKAITFIFTITLLASCNVVTNSLKTSQRKINRQVETNAINTRLVNKPILAELEIGIERITSIYKTTNQDIANSVIMSGQSDSKKSTFLTTASESMKNEAKNRAQFKFIEDNKCDYVVDPIYKIETESTSGSSIVTITVEIAAYPAKYKKFTQPDSLPKSVFEFGRLDSREIPLSTTSNTSNTTRNESKSESGILFGGNYSNLPKNALALTYGSNLSKYNQPSFGGTLGFYKISPLSEKLGLRTELLLSYNRLKYDFAQAFLDNYGVDSIQSSNDYYNYSAMRIEVPILFNLKAGKNLELQGGLSINYNLKTQESYKFSVFGVNYEGKKKIDVDKRIGSGVILGGYLQSNSSFGVGLRQQFGIGKEKWSITSLMIGFKF